MTGSKIDAMDENRIDETCATLRRYLGEEKGALTLDRVGERLSNETVAVTMDDVRAVIGTDAVSVASTADGRAITSVDVYDSGNRETTNEFAEEVDGMSGEYGGISVDFVASSNEVTDADSMPATTADVTGDDLTELSGIGGTIANDLVSAGFDSFDDVKEASPSDLTTVEGVGQATADTIREEASAKCDPVARIAAAAFNRATRAGGDAPTGADGTESDLSRIKRANDVDIPAGDPIAADEHFNGLPVLRDTGNPFIPDVGSTEPFKTRTLETGNEDVEDISRMMGAGEDIGLVGYPGTGKDTLIEHICAQTNRPVLRLSADSSMLSQDLLGFHVTDESGQVVWQNGVVPKTVEDGWTLVIDEPNALDAGVSLALNQLLEDDGFLYIPDDNKVIEPHPSFRFIATMNPAEPGFGGTDPLNDAFRERLLWFKLGYLAPQDEAELVDARMNADARVFTSEQVLELVDMANDFREAVDSGRALPRLSTRHLLKMGTLARGAPNKRGAIEEVVVGACGPRDDGEAAAAMVDNLEEIP